ncbi:hypothetical protein Taro_054696, partial [Colocasia esculenta]|nr:hypothetical protein [Colocasia esculenta]
KRRTHQPLPLLANLALASKLPGRARQSCHRTPHERTHHHSLAKLRPHARPPHTASEPTQSEAVRNKDCLGHAGKKTPQRPWRPTLDKRALQTTQCRCPNLIFPSALESANSAANSSTLGSQAMETTSERDKPSSAKHRVNRRGKHNKNHAEPWLVTHNKPSKHEACMDPQEGRRPTKAHTTKPEPRKTTSQYGKRRSANNR